MKQTTRFELVITFVVIAMAWGGVDHSQAKDAEQASVQARLEETANLMTSCLAVVFTDIPEDYIIYRASLMMSQNNQTVSISNLPRRLSGSPDWKKFDVPVKYDKLMSGYSYDVTVNYTQSDYHTLTAEFCFWLDRFESDVSMMVTTTFFDDAGHPLAVEFPNGNSTVIDVVRNHDSEG